MMKKDDSKQSKNEIREKILQLRRCLTEEQREYFTQNIIRKILLLPEYQQAESIFCYMAVRGEISVQGLIEDAMKKGKKVAVPRVRENEMEFCRIKDISQLQSGCFGIMEPDAACPVIKPDVGNGIAVFPGVAFDCQGFRVGYGGGYYDRYFSNYPNVYKIAPVFPFQIISAVPREPHDICVDLVVTEENEKNNLFLPFID